MVEALAAAGVRRIYGIVGDSLNGLTESLRRQERIEWIGVRHEEVAAFAAGAEAHVTGSLAVCAGSCPKDGFVDQADPSNNAGPAASSGVHLAPFVISTVDYGGPTCGPQKDGW